MFAIRFAINLRPVAVILRRWGFVSCNQRAHGPPMFAIPAADVCRSLQLDNGQGIYQAGDNVQTVERWHPLKTWDGLDSALLNRILDDIEAGCPDGTSRYSTATNAKGRAAWQVVVKHAPDKNEKQAREAIATWVKSGTLYFESYHDAAARKKFQGLRVNQTLRPS